MKILYISPVPYEGAGCRFRIYQYIPYLTGKGIRCSVSPFLFKQFFRIVYRQGNVFLKILFFIISLSRRIFDLARAFNYDLVVIYRESFPFGPPIFEYLLHLFRKKIIFDFDDAIFLPSASDANRILARLRRFDNTGKIIKISNAVIAGNDYLRDYASKFNLNIYVIPTVIDMNKFRPVVRKDSQKIVIGWIGTNSTQKYLLLLENVFRVLVKKYPDIEIRIIGSQSNILGLKGVVYRDWLLEREICDIQEFSIGVMPIPDTEWAKGKCAFKIIQYMALGIPAVASGVGTNRQVIQDGVTGFLVSSEEEWIAKISSLIENPCLREKIGLAGRKFVEEKYSLREHAVKYSNVILQVINEK
jgi:glycosyltransferase involved in cell wall biosynthesis